jgi:hypothetical protein
MTEREIQEAILRVCKVAGHDSDINMVGFLVLCDKLKQLGAEAERKACADITENWNSNGMPRTGVANEIRKRGQS